MPSTRGTRVIRDDPRLSDLLDEVVHVDVDLGHDVSTPGPAYLARFFPHSHRLVDLRGALMIFRLDQVPRVGWCLSPSVILGHRDGPLRRGGMEPDPAEDVPGPRQLPRAGSREQ